MLTRRNLILATVALLALAGSFGAGRYSQPAEVVTVDKVRTEVQWRDVDRVQVVHDVQTVHDVATKTVTVTRWAKAPDGTPVVTQETHAERQSETTRAATSRAQRDHVIEAHELLVETHDRSEHVDPPAWSATLLAGGQLGGRRLFDALPAPIIAGVVLERRILGPVSAGLWATTGMAGGISVRLDW